MSELKIIALLLAAVCITDELVHHVFKKEKTEAQLLAEMQERRYEMNAYNEILKIIEDALNKMYEWNYDPSETIVKDEYNNGPVIIANTKKEEN